MSAIGSATQPVFINDKGVPSPCGPYPKGAAFLGTDANGVLIAKSAPAIPAGDLITINGNDNRTVNVKNSIPAGYTGPIGIDANRQLVAAKLMWGGVIGYKYNVNTDWDNDQHDNIGYRIGQSGKPIDDSDTTTPHVMDARGFGFLNNDKNSFLTYTAQTDCILFISSGDTSIHVGDAYSIWTIEKARDEQGNILDYDTLKYEIFRHVEFFKGVELKYSFQLPVKKGTRIGIAFHVVKFRLMLDNDGTWHNESPFVICDVPQDPSEVSDASVTNRTWDYMYKLAKRSTDLSDLSGYPENIYTTSPYKFEITEMALA